jgi:hypothetical protein
VIAIEDRIPDFSDKELERLHANAVRLAQSGTPAQRERAERLLPLVRAALETRSAARAATQRETRTAMAKRKGAAAKNKKDGAT